MSSSESTYYHELSRLALSQLIHSQAELFLLHPPPRSSTRRLRLPTPSTLRLSEPFLDALSDVSGALIYSLGAQALGRARLSGRNRPNIVDVLETLEGRAPHLSVREVAKYAMKVEVPFPGLAAETKVGGGGPTTGKEIKGEWIEGWMPGLQEEEDDEGTEQAGNGFVDGLKNDWREKKDTDPIPLGNGREKDVRESNRDDGKLWEIICPCVPYLKSSVKMSNVKAVVWDMDGVLLDSEPIYLQVEQAIVSRYDKDIRTILPLLIGRTANVCAEITVSELSLPLTPAEFLRERNEQLLVEMRKVKFLPGVERTVKHLVANGVKCAIATSSPRNLLNAKKTGKDEFFALFDYLVCGDDVQNGKPDPEIFLKAANGIGMQPEDCVVFEDAPAGVRAAKNAGMTVIALPNEAVDMSYYEKEKPDFIVKSARLLDFDLGKVGLPKIET